MNQSPSGSTVATPATTAPQKLRFTEMGTQTEQVQSKFMRTFSVMQPHKRNKALDEDVMNLIDSCRRYQVSEIAKTGRFPTYILSLSDILLYCYTFSIDACKKLKYL